MPSPVAYPAPAEPASNPLQMPEAEYLEFIRTRSIGGSQAGMILGLSEYGGPADAWDRILGVTPPSETNSDMERGRWLEDIAVELYELQTGRLTQMVSTRVPHPTFSFLHSSPDRMILHPASMGATPLQCLGNGVGILEVKCPRVRGFQRVRTEGVSRSYYAQLQLYMDAHECEWGSFAIFNAELWELHWFDVPRDDAFVDDMLVELERFWHEHVLTRMRPGSRRPSVVSVPPRVGADGVARSDPEWRQAVQELRQARADFSFAELRKKAAEGRVKALMGDCELVIGGGARITWRFQARRTLDPALLRDAGLTDLRQYERETVSRVFRPTFDD